MTASPSPTVQVTHRFDASAERVFDAWLDSGRAGKWLFATPTGQMTRVEIDPRVGGKFCFVDRRDGEDVEHVGEYLEIDRPRRLVFTLLVSKFQDHVTRVTVEIESRGSGCQLTLTQDNVLADFAGRTRSGWATVLDNLAAELARADHDRPA